MYRPSYCCDCGEAIERVNWRIFTSRRFCDSCESTFLFDEWLNRVAFGMSILIGLIGVGAYFSSGNQEMVNDSFEVENVIPESSAPRGLVGSEEKKRRSKGADEITSDNTKVGVEVARTPSRIEDKEVGKARQKQKQALIGAQIEVEEPVYFCGAATKKGKPCSRRVKGGGRCWQHTGKKAMVKESKLRIE